jgi:ABC-type multidrug transport system permease subunit
MNIIKKIKDWLFMGFFSWLAVFIGGIISTGIIHRRFYVGFDLPSTILTILFAGIVTDYIVRHFRRR